ncbi:MAG TPA: hypothetical protein VH595_09245 [Verrucomicrobiae bacterium]|jgi:hypothetical protein|nr:hypothetical protein [Verrucomicrobiae bacterium]
MDLERIPNRLALAGGWIDQPFVSHLNPKPPGSMVVVSLEPSFQPMERAGFAGGTRAVARQLWKGRIPNRPPEDLVHELYAAENHGRAQPSGSQDMIGLIYPGISRLDYDIAVHEGIFPSHIESLNDPGIARWLERSLFLLPIAPRPDHYNPLEEKHLVPDWIARLGQSGKDCFEAIRRMDINALGASMNECMACWEAILPCVVRHRALRTDLKAVLQKHQRGYPGAMFSGCGGGYLFVASKEPVPGAFQITVRIKA